MIVLSEVQKAVLSSLEYHGKCDLRGFYDIFPHYDKTLIDSALTELQKMGWLKVRKSQVIDGTRYDIPNVQRTKKTLYTEQSLF